MPSVNVRAALLTAAYNQAIHPCLSVPPDGVVNNSACKFATVAWLPLLDIVCTDSFSITMFSVCHLETERQWIMSICHPRQPKSSDLSHAHGTP